MVYLNNNVIYMAKTFTQLKTYKGLAAASVKSKKGLVIASIKSVKGVV